jgi:hypothetical protein
MKTETANLSEASLKSLLLNLSREVRALANSNRYTGQGAAELQYDLLQKLNYYDFQIKNGHKPMT